MGTTILDIDVCGSFILASGMDKTHHLIDIETKEIVQSFLDHTKYVVKCVFGGGGSWFATGSRDKTVCLYRRVVDGSYILAQTLNFLGPVESMCIIDKSTLVVGTRDDCNLHYFPIKEYRGDRLEVGHEAYNMNANGDDHCSFTPMHIALSPNKKSLLIFTDSESGRLLIQKTFSNASTHQLALYGPIVDGYVGFIISHTKGTLSRDAVGMRAEISFMRLAMIILYW
jgi:COMPASS component SWD3